MSQFIYRSDGTIIYIDDNSGDCIIHHHHPTSLQEMLLYLNYAKVPETSDNAVNQRNKAIARERVREIFFP